MTAVEDDRDRLRAGRDVGQKCVQFEVEQQRRSLEAGVDRHERLVETCRGTSEPRFLDVVDLDACAVTGVVDEDPVGRPDLVGTERHERRDNVLQCRFLGFDRHVRHVRRVRRHEAGDLGCGYVRSLDEETLDAVDVVDATFQRLLGVGVDTDQQHVIPAVVGALVRHHRHLSDGVEPSLVRFGMAPPTRTR